MQPTLHATSSVSFDLTKTRLLILCRCANAAGERTKTKDGPCKARTCCSMWARSSKSTLVGHKPVIFRPMFNRRRIQKIHRRPSRRPRCPAEALAPQAPESGPAPPHAPWPRHARPP